MTMRILKAQIYGMHKATSTNIFMAKVPLLLKKQRLKWSIQLRNLEGIRNKQKKKYKENKQKRHNTGKSKMK